MNYTIFTVEADQLNDRLKKQSITISYLATPAGILELHLLGSSLIKATYDCPQTGIAAPEKIEGIQEIILSGTPFECAVWQEALKIKPGTTISYQNLAHALGKPNSFRAVANALGKNNLAYIIPCHRVVRADGALGGYKWGIDKKTALLASEKK